MRSGRPFLRVFTLLATLVALLAPASARPAAEAANNPTLPFFGVYLLNRSASNADSAATIGAGTAIVRIAWSELQATESAPWDPNVVAQLDSTFAELASRSITPIALVGGAPSWAAYNDHGPLRDGKQDAFLALIRYLVGRYSVAPYGVHYWSLWPEPDAMRNPPSWVDAAAAARAGWGNDGAAFADLMTSTYAAIKGPSGIDKSATVILGPIAHDWFYDPGTNSSTPGCGGVYPGLGNCGGIFRYLFLDDVLSRLQTTGGTAFDVIGLNAYIAFATAWEYDDRQHGGTGVDVAAKIDHLRRRLAKYNLSTPILIIESGFWSGGDSVPLSDGAGNAIGSLTPSPQAQATYVGKLYARARSAGVLAAGWFTLEEGDATTKYGLLDGSGTAKPAVTAYNWAASALASTTRSTTTASAFSTVDGSVESYAFVGGGKYTAVAWATGSASPSAHVSASPGLTAYDWSGARVSPTSTGSDGRPVYQLDDKPLYFQRANSTAYVPFTVRVAPFGTSRPN